MTLNTIIAILILLLAGIACLCRVYEIAATTPGQPGYQSVLSQLTAAADGRGPFYYLTMFSVFIVLALSANTSFADFPRACRSIVEKRYLPYLFTLRGPRLVFSVGIYMLAFVAGFLLIVFDGVTDRLIPLFAVGAFTAFTLSQAGMVMHWNRAGGQGALRSSPRDTAKMKLGMKSTRCLAQQMLWSDLWQLGFLIGCDFRFK